MTIHTPVLRTPVSPDPSIDDLAATVVRLGRELATAAHGCCAGGGALDHAFVARSLEPLARRRPFDERDVAGLGTARALISNDLRRETAGTERQVVDHEYDEDGVRYDVWAEVAAFTERGEQLRAVLQRLDEFVRARDAVLDYAAGQHGLRRVLSG